MVMITLYAKQQKRHSCKKQTFWTLWERARVGLFGRMSLKHVYYHMWDESPVQVQCMRQGVRAGALGWHRGMERVRRGFRMGNTCTPMADSCQCMAKPLQYCKVISLQLKINKLKKNMFLTSCFYAIFFEKNFFKKWKEEKWVNFLYWKKSLFLPVIIL